MDFHVGQNFGDYSITARLGDGAMGCVYRVENCLTKRTESMKVLAAELATEIQVKRFEREMRALARLSHPNIAALHNAFHSENQLILLMEFIEGRTLENIFNNARLPIDTGIGYIKQILYALQHAHQQGVVHRDVRPANVIVTATGEVKLADFGLSKSYGDSLLTNCGEILGSLPYLAPEQLKGVTQPDKRSDLYSVGAILYEHLTGRKPFGDNRRLAPVLTDTEGEPPWPSQLEPGLAPEWDAIIQRTLAKDPGRRYQSAGELLEAISQLDGEPRTEFVFPNLHPVALGMAIAFGVILALATSSFKFFQPVEPPAAGLLRVHIAPPAFAAVAPKLSLSRDEHHLGAAHSFHAKGLQRHASVSANSELVVPTTRDAQGIEKPVAMVAATSNLPQQLTDVPLPVFQESPAHHPKRFWSKLNRFRKRKNAEP